MDLEVTETGNGGDLVKTTKDVSVIYGFENMVYLALFGGNVESSTESERIESEQAFDYWGNQLMPNDPSIQFNSLTERTLKSVALNSSGRLIIEQAIKKDLQFMQAFAVVVVEVVIISTDRIAIGIKLTQPNNAQRKEFIYIWDATRDDLLSKEFIIGGGGIVTRKIFSPEFDFTFE